ncbi:unnamed protein product [Dovyalis caffra]|uniref:Uncharacterized protein n=1 Tax=Dovyalis caffra TaxID=77055 RepID=A0AAV1RAN3_9ROSI|nr:unnamed protein product [Dovyalis caffra]
MGWRLSFRVSTLRITIRANAIRLRKHYISLIWVANLREAGMKFKPLPDECLLDIRAWSSINNGDHQKREGNSVRKGELHIPRLEIDDNTECLFRNLMALEQCHYPRQEYICHYVKLLDFLVDIEEDVDLLVKKKVIVNRIGDSKAVVEMINKLCLEIQEVSSCYDGLAQQLNDYYENWWNESKAYLRRVYFKNVSVGTGTVVGLFNLANETVTHFPGYFFQYFIR